MAFISITRLRIRSWRFMPPFVVDTLRSLSQTKAAPGFIGGSLLADRKRTFWTLTLWTDQSDMRRYMISGAHRKAMPKLLGWCDEASVAHWTQEAEDIPTWDEAAERMRSEGRVSKVRHPSPQHRDLSFARPRTAGAVAITPRGGKAVSPVGSSDKLA
ncbi:DUF3291 domain-containing protein [Methylobacterium sp. J-092]|uniref:DUF3291 domain-containing protein n=1 Tax=Methylobacterium sp. J-092 TaxID=2836667 RepID=UPI001FB9FB4E|nr:DUF3291 domain-containing protein [Methylobacterium sp. J-092]MCJ2009387.1 DUF3291 domain-containing protein [Methylobacterium sp. J-092]